MDEGNPDRAFKLLDAVIRNQRRSLAPKSTNCALRDEIVELFDLLYHDDNYEPIDVVASQQVLIFVVYCCCSIFILHILNN